ncbi:MAG TPA: cytochrome d ubiquinol oxidase subunit II [Pseudoxanthomonas sp.]|nr:cytochrome d ubiquinol oxidase subunit II [Pseudoxanthomonas sp.]
MDTIPLDYPTLRLIWWLLLGILLIGFAVMDGFDLGVATLLPAVARSDEERRIVLNVIGPVWEGNQVWLILGGGAIFAAWPPLYAVSFSGFYLAMYLILVALILRPVGFKFRSKVPHPRWRTAWDWALFVSGVVPALVFGVAMGNVLLGVPFHFDEILRPHYSGGFFDLLTPFALLCGLVSVTLLVAHGAGMLVIKTDGVIALRAGRLGGWAALLAAALLVLGGIWLATGINGYALQVAVDPAGPSNPLNKVVVSGDGLWMANYARWPWLWLLPVLSVIGLLISAACLRVGRGLLAFLGSALAIVCVILTVGFTTFPFLLPSSTQPGSSLTVWDASSSHMTLFVMLVATAIFLPLILLYTAWVFRVLRGKVSAEHLGKNQNPNAY